MKCGESQLPNTQRHKNDGIGPQVFECTEASKLKAKKKNDTTACNVRDGNIHLPV